MIQKEAKLRADTSSMRSRHVRDFFGDVLNARILDVGCADGAMLREASQLNEVYGVDVSDMVWEAKHYRGVQQVDLEYGSIDSIAGFFDFVYAGECLEHIANTRHVLSEIWRVMKPSGWLYVTVPNARHIPALFSLAVLNRPFGTHAQYKSLHVRDWTSSTIRDALTEHGFDVFSVLGCGLGPKWPMVMSRVFSLFPSINFQIRVLAQKQ